jgi:DNA polymerase III epsilon subunit-like protein
MGMLKREGIHPDKVICTMKLSRFLDEDGVIPKYNLQYLRYFLNLNVEAVAHDASGDVVVLEALFQRIHAKMIEKLGTDAVDKMIAVSSKPSLIKPMSFGKHQGIKMEDIPIDYLNWLSTTDLDEDLEYTVNRNSEKSLCRPYACIYALTGCIKDIVAG